MSCHVMSLLDENPPLTSHLYENKSQSPRNGLSGYIPWAPLTPRHQLLFFPYSLCSSPPTHSAVVILTSLLFLECIRQVLALEDLHWLFSLPVTLLPIIFIAHSLISLRFLFKSVDFTQPLNLKLQNSPIPPLILLPPLCFFSCKPYCHLPSHILLTFPVYFLPPSTRIKRQGFCLLC